MMPKPCLIETMRVVPGGGMPLLEDHLQRLSSSSAALQYPWPGRNDVVGQIAHYKAELDISVAWRLRLLLDPDGHLSLSHSPLPESLPPLSVIVHGPRLSGHEEWLQHKTTHRPWYEKAAEWLAQHPQVFDVLFWNDKNEMCEGSRTNIFMRTQDGRWLTPPLSSGALPGVQRQAILDAGLAMEATIHRDEFLAAKAWRVSNALRGWCDAVPAPVSASF